MEEWKEYKLGEIVDLVIDYRGKTPLKLGGSWSEDGYRALSAKNIKTGQIVNEDSIRYVDEELYHKWMKDEVQKGDILITSEAPFGQIYYWDSEEKIVLSQRLFCLRLSKTVHPHFVYYYMTTHAFQHELDGRSTGTTVVGLRQPELMKCRIMLPSYTTQVMISSILKSLDDKIQVNRRINNNLEQQAQALFKSWLMNCEDEVTIGDLSQNITDYTKCEQNKVVLINSSDVTEGHFEHHNLSDNINLKGHFKKRFQKGDILYSQVRPRNRHWGYCTFNADNYLASTQLMVIRNKPKVISSILLYQYIIEDNVWMDFTLRTETRSGTFPQGNYEDLSSIKVPFGADINDITMQLEIIYSLVYKNEQESHRLAELRDSLLPRLMFGEINVTDTDLVDKLLKNNIR